MKELVAYYLDASALVKVFISESRSGIVKKLIANNSQIFTTTLCATEALRVFKRKYISKSSPPNMIAYADCCLDLVSSLDDEVIRIDDQPIFSRKVYDETEKLILKHELDVSDMLQILSIRSSFSKRIGMKCFLVTDDENLHKAALKEQIETIFLRDPKICDLLQAAG